MGGVTGSELLSVTSLSVSENSALCCTSVTRLGVMISMSNDGLLAKSGQTSLFKPNVEGYPAPWPTKSGQNVYDNSIS